MSQYEYDVFISYRRKPLVLNWLQKLFHPTLNDWLPNCIGGAQEPRIFVDSQAIEVGTAWPNELEEAVRRSRCLLAIWSPEYFRSSWCMAEWQSFVARQKALVAGAVPLIYPIRFADGEYYPEDARNTHSDDFRDLVNISGRTVRFRNAVKRVAEELATRIQHAPAWQHWPVERPSPAALHNPPLSRLT